MNTTDLFWAKVDRRGPDECWEWTAHRDPDGYGRFSPRHRHQMPASRFSWELAYGPAPEAMFVLHTCDNPSCCNPRHLFLGTNADNMRDKAIKGRSLRGERHNMAKLTSEDVRAIRRKVAAGVPRGEVASEYRVHRATIDRAVNGKRWVSVPFEEAQP